MCKLVFIHLVNTFYSFLSNFPLIFALFQVVFVLLLARYIVHVLTTFYILGIKRSVHLKTRILGEASWDLSKWRKVSTCVVSHYWEGSASHWHAKSQKIFASH
jgi:hypothetical protein